MNGDGQLQRQTRPLWQRILQPLASLRLTVVLFALSLILVFYGTWAQVDQGIWYVVSKYFRSLWVWIPVKVIVFHSIDESPFAIPFPGGWLLGGLLFANLLAAHALRFKMTWRRSGIFILHAGLILMMLGEFFTGLFAVESMMTIEERTATNYAQHLHDAELAVIDMTDPKLDDTVAIPHRVLRNGLVSHEKLPFDIQLVEYMENAVEVPLEAGAKNPVTAGLGLQATARGVPVVSGADPNQKIDTPAAFITLKDKTTGQALDTYLVHFFWPAQSLTIGDKKYEIALRPKRSYRDFSVFLEKADYKVHPRTKRAKDYSSWVQIKDKDGKEIRKARIYMNHPLYFNGETYFQSNMSEPGRQPMSTGLQVVRNFAWPLPYWSLLMVSIGMLVHFGINLFEFLQRRMT